MASWNIAVVGANGQVGRSIIELLANSALTIAQLDLLGSDNSEGEAVRFDGKNLVIKHIKNMDWSNCHLAFFVANQSVSEQYARSAAQAGCIVLDATGTFSLDEAIPLIVPQLNDSILGDYRNENIVSIANPIVSQALRCLAALTDVELLTQLHITNMIPASFYGKQGVNELAGQSARLLNGLPAEHDFFAKQLAFNVLPSMLVDDSFIVEQIKRITGNYQLSITIDSVLVPVFYGLTQSISFMSATTQGIEQNEALFDKYGIRVISHDYPTPVTVINSEQADSLAIMIANVHHSYGNQEQIQLMSVSDNIRYLGAKMLLETAESLLTNYIE
ncbi:aspartate-semialdehyde dehydrogenase [Orbus hercynius]|uniref:Aspartate-semialdehyde dehydrogenase n=1 Tax=Orbus hercynius TaxID=593135 RepID=A0A495RBG4_9GAMM|nr:aspartate-semialdehyde dehydrogenase [Orbus hercynius]RKS84739.1 aspartate-semialdehyde dehydrogenase [Orbus hercynius]